jgi:hypothetical protein
MVPKEALPPVIPPTCQVTVVFVEFPIVAVNCFVAPPATVELVGEMLMVTAGGGGFPPPPPPPPPQETHVSAENESRIRTSFFIGSSSRI